MTSVFKTTGASVVQSGNERDKLWRADGTTNLSTDIQRCMQYFANPSARVLDPEEEAAQAKIDALLKHRGYTAWKMSDEQVWEAVAVLRKSDETVRKAAAKVFAKMGPAATKALAQQLSSKDPTIRAVAAELIGYMGKKVGEEYIESLAPLLKDHDGAARRAAVAAVGALGEPGRTKAADVAQLLKDPDTDVRRLAVEALRRMEPAAQVHIEAVLELLNDKEWTVRRSAVETVGSMKEASLAHSDRIAEKLNDREWLVRGAAAETLGRLGELAIKHAADLQELLVDKEWFVRNVAAEALHSLGPDGQRLLEIHHEGMRSSAAEQLATRFHPPKAKIEEPVEEKPAGARLKADDKYGGRRQRMATRAMHAHGQNEDAKQLQDALAAHNAKMSASRANDAHTARFYAGMT